jgi:hypothetical protein
MAKKNAGKGRRPKTTSAAALPLSLRIVGTPTISTSGSTVTVTVGGIVTQVVTNLSGAIANAADGAPITTTTTPTITNCNWTASVVFTQPTGQKSFILLIVGETGLAAASDCVPIVLS